MTAGFKGPAFIHAAWTGNRHAPQEGRHFSKDSGFEESFWKIGFEESCK